jgi:hypothetical protein
MLTDDMTRLSREIHALRKMRGSLMHELQHDAKGLKQTVAKMCTHFGRARMAMAKRTKHERVAFLNNLKRSVDAQRQEMRDDLAGARQAWAGRRL